MSRRIAGLVALLSCLLSGRTAAAQSPADGPAKFTIADRVAPAGTRTVCLGRRDQGIRVVGCFDVYELRNGGMFDSNKKVQVRQFVWKYTAEARTTGRSKTVTSLTSEVRSDSGDTYDWAPGAGVSLSHPMGLESAVTVDFRADEASSGSKPAIIGATDGWRYAALTGEIVPYLTTHSHSVTWNASSKRPLARSEVPQVAGATLWGVPEPAPDVMPAHLQTKAGYR